MTAARRTPPNSFFVGLRTLLVCCALACWLLPAAPAAAEVLPTFLYKLSDFDGPVAFKTAQLDVDVLRKEIYVADTRLAEVRIFNESGMEVYRFGDDGSFGSLIDIAISDPGDIFVLGQAANQPLIIRCDFRGRPLNRVLLKNLPAEYATALPNRMTYWNERLYLLDTIHLRLVVTDTDGLFQKGYDLARLFGIEEKNRTITEIGGFSVDPRGNMLFTVPVLFSAFRLSPEGDIISFGTPGSAPGRFGVVGGIVADAQGYCYVADRLKSVVLVFDPELKFQTEFGYRGRQPHNLISPGDIGLDADGRLYVSQMGNRGVSVFKISHP